MGTREIRWILCLVLGCGACSSSPGELGGGDGGVTGACTVTGHNTPEKAISLNLGETYPAASGVQDTCIYPTRMQLWFTVEVPADRPLLTVQIAFPPQAKSKVNLAYVVLKDPADTQHPLGAGVDQDETVHASRVVGTHYLRDGAGTYYVMVHDAGDNAQDDLSTFGITVSANQDPDPNEAGGNDDCAHAVDVGAGQDGFIAYQGDHDAFKVSLPAGATIIDVVLDSLNQVSLVRYQAELFAPDGATLLYEDSNPSGGVTNIHSRRGVTGSGGEYCFLIRDLDDTAADPQHGYHIAVTIKDEPDANESPQRNDFPAGATDLGSGGTRTAFIASTGDSDWYAIHQSPNGLIEAHAAGSPGAPVKLGLTLAYPHTTTPCTVTDSCAYLTGTQTCTLPSDCQSGVCQRGRCALDCQTNLDCPGLFCSQSSGLAGACAAGGVCLPEGQCSVSQYIKPSDDNNDVHTVQPAFAPITYVLVHDTHNPPVYDEGGSYTFTGTARAEPDSAEPDNFYNPFLSLESPETDPEDVIRKNEDFGRTLPLNTTMSGYISYEGDIDVWKFPNPCTSGNCSLRLSYNRPGGPVDYVYFGYGPWFGLSFSWRAADEGGDTVFGDAGPDECAFVDNGDGENYLIIRDWHHNKWDVSNAYTISISGSAGCTGGCQPYQDTCQPAP